MLSVEKIEETKKVLRVVMVSRDAQRQLEREMRELEQDRDRCYRHARRFISDYLRAEDDDVATVRERIVQRDQFRQRFTPRSHFVANPPEQRIMLYLSSLRYFQDIITDDQITELIWVYYHVQLNDWETEHLDVLFTAANRYDQEENKAFYTIKRYLSDYFFEEERIAQAA